MEKIRKYNIWDILYLYYNLEEVEITWYFYDTHSNDWMAWYYNTKTSLKIHEEVFIDFRTFVTKYNEPILRNIEKLKIQLQEEINKLK